MPNRRHLLAAASLLLAAGGRPALAQARFNSLYMFIPAGPGGGWDGLGRAIEQVARQAGLVGTFQFENVGGAGGTVGLPRFVGQRRGRPDSLLVAGSIMVGATLTNRTPVGLKDLVPVARLTAEAGVIVVPAQSEIQDLKAFLEALKANPGGVAIAGGSAGGTDHITLGLILKALGHSAKDGSYVAFAGGGPAQAAILGAQVKAGISGLSEFAEQIKAGRMRALATTGAERTDPAVPTLKESGVDVVMTNWRGVFAPPGLRPEARQKLVDFITELHALPAWREMLKTRDWADAFLTGDAFTAFLAEDQAKTEAVLKEVGLA
ncbi:tripartite tricarboxylate transporter substrate binding protein [Siccirubricoccus phaeus]|uniref:tripartite tricarboxylate transporter substrate binding protein n=1 Tax=Siccirubricoccus phaeus TaxID=2595053 RepID=UPI0011F1050E|nr:tripartite tricarboxylate transporter substrate-binding protein [Siccirubricoccus phaeus]